MIFFCVLCAIILKLDNLFTGQLRACARQDKSEIGLRIMRYIGEDDCHAIEAHYHKKECQNYTKQWRLEQS